ncbi:MAG TPA: hypothetical protein VFS53_01850 [Gemmatimonadota bacterium]|nr:hypothetical protein [Gemmatimonadota bacterium]
MTTPRWTQWTVLVVGVVSMAVTGSFVTACGYVRVPFEVSGPVALPPGVEGTVLRDGLTTLRLDDLELRFEARNQRARGVGVAIAPMMVFPVPIPTSASEVTADTEDLPFFLFVELAPRAAGFAFDPTAIRVTRIGGIPMSPVAYAGPGRTSGQRCVEPTSGKDRLPRSVEARSFSLTPAEEPTCFAVLFGKQLFPTTRFALDLEGLTRAGAPMIVPTIELERRSASAVGEPRTWRPASLRP